MSNFTFFVLTTLYFFAKYKFPDKKSSSDKKNNTTEIPQITKRKYIPLIIYICYILITIAFEYSSNLITTISLCGSAQPGNALLFTLIPWCIIFLGFNLILANFKGWLVPFSNTFGYGIAYLAGLNTLLTNILKPQDFDIKDKSGLNKALETIYKDRSSLINEIPSDRIDFDKFIKNDNYNTLFIPSFLNDENNIESLYNYIRLKNYIAEWIWYLLTGFLTISVASNYIINSACNFDVTEMKQKHDEYVSMLDEEKNVSAPEPPVYKEHE